MVVVIEVFSLWLFTTSFVCRHLSSLFGSCLNISCNLSQLLLDFRVDITSSDVLKLLPGFRVGTTLLDFVRSTFLSLFLLHAEVASEYDTREYEEE
jgi:hypothetical protein